MLDASGYCDRCSLLGGGAVLCSERGWHLQCGAAEALGCRERTVCSLRQVEREHADRDIGDGAESAASDARLRIDERFTVKIDNNPLSGEHDHQFREFQAGVTNEICGSR